MAELIAMAGDHAGHKDWDIRVNAVEEVVTGERIGRHKPPPSRHLAATERIDT